MANAALAWIVGFLSSIQIGLLALGAAGIPSERTSAAALAVIGAALASWLARSIHRESAASGRSRHAPLAVTPAGTPATLIALLAIAWAVTVWGRLWGLALRRPPYDWDGLYYHLPALNAWAVRGHVTWVDGMPDIPFVNYPMAVEAFTFFAHQLLGGVSLSSALNLWFWPLGFFALVVIARQIGARGPWPWLAGALVAGAPVVVSQGATAYIDTAFGFAVMTAIAAMLVFVFEDDAPTASRALLLGASCGLVLGAKGTGAPFAAILLVVSLAAVAVFHGRRQFAHWARALGLAVVAAVLVGGYWYVRNTLHTSNPLHPVELKVGPLVLREGYNPGAILETNLPDHLRPVPRALAVPASWLQWDAPISGYAPVGGLGYVWVGFALPAAMALAARRFPRRVRWPTHMVDRRSRSPQYAAAYTTLVTLAGVLLTVQPAAWWSRFTIWLLALGLPALVVVLQALVGSRAPERRWAGLAVLLAVVGVSIWESERTLALERQTGRVAGASARADGYRASVDVLFPGLAETDGFDRLLAARRLARSPWSRFGTLLGGVLAVPFGARDVRVLPVVPSRDDVARLQADGIEWVLWDETSSGAVPAVMAERAVEAHVWRTATGDAIFHAIRLPPRGGVLPRTP